MYSAVGDTRMVVQMDSPIQGTVVQMNSRSTVSVRTDTATVPGTWYLVPATGTNYLVLLTVTWCTRYVPVVQHSRDNQSTIDLDLFYHAARVSTIDYLVSL
jgi:hypothetical protein